MTQFFEGENWRKRETAALKTAFNKAGIKARIRHGTGTAWMWLHVKVSLDRCTETEVQAILDKVTGRTGEYDGRVNIDTY